MKVVLNTITNYGGQTLKPNDITDIDLRIAQRWIARGIAHEYREQVKQVWKANVEPISKLIKKAKKK